jgi:hypothetical protein
MCATVAALYLSGAPDVLEVRMAVNDITCNLLAGVWRIFQMYLTYRFVRIPKA